MAIYQVTMVVISEKGYRLTKHLRVSGTSEQNAVINAGDLVRKDHPKAKGINFVSMSRALES